MLSLMVLMSILYYMYQVAVSSGHAEEALANIRTVRAFAMEKEEEEKYAKALADAEALNLRLGIGIGAFQVCHCYEMKKI